MRSSTLYHGFDWIAFTTEDGSALGASEEPAAMSCYRHSSAQHSAHEPHTPSSIDVSQIQTELEDASAQYKFVVCPCVTVGSDGRCAFLP